MSYLTTRALSTSSRAAIKWIGNVTLNDIIEQNGSSGEKLKDAVVVMAETLEKENPKIVEAKVQGATAHKSSRDKTDEQKVITVGFTAPVGPGWHRDMHMKTGHSNIGLVVLEDNRTYSRGLQVIDCNVTAHMLNGQEIEL